MAPGRCRCRQLVRQGQVCCLVKVKARIRARIRVRIRARIIKFIVKSEDSLSARQGAIMYNCTYVFARHSTIIDMLDVALSCTYVFARDGTIIYMLDTMLSFIC